MATIQVRDVPEDVHRTYRERAARAGMSLQEYLRSELVRGARLRTAAELADDIERRIQHAGGEGYLHDSSVATDVIREMRGPI